jgi:MFS family permease
VARLFSGIGAILLNVLISKMVADWFVKERIATAMGIVISSWPLGIAIALLTIGLLQESIGLLSTQLVPAVLCAIAFIMISRLYTSPPTSTQSTQPINEQSGIRFSNTEFIGIVLSGLIWCFYNVALILLLSFGAEYLVSNGLALITANATVSLTSWLIIPAIPLGAWLAEKYERQVVTMVISFITVALLALLIPFTSSHLVLFALLGIAFGPAAGLIMALPAKILSEQNRAMGMGVFWTIYYIGMGVFPSLGGYLRESTNNPAAPIYLACTIILMTLPLLAAQQFLQQRQPVKN